MQNRNALRWFSGASGRIYTYGQLDANNLSLLTFSAGNFIFARDNGSDMEIVCVGEAESIYGILTNTTAWLTAKARFGADLIFCHPAGDPAARDAEKRDLIKQWQPQMNTTVDAENRDLSVPGEAAEARIVYTLMAPRFALRRPDCPSSHVL